MMTTHSSCAPQTLGNQVHHFAPEPLHMHQQQSHQLRHDDEQQQHFFAQIEQQQHCTFCQSTRCNCNHESGPNAPNDRDANESSHDHQRHNNQRSGQISPIGATSAGAAQQSHERQQQAASGAQQQQSAGSNITNYQNATQVIDNNQNNTNSNSNTTTTTTNNNNNNNNQELYGANGSYQQQAIECDWSMIGGGSLQEAAGGDSRLASSSSPNMLDTGRPYNSALKANKSLEGNRNDLNNNQHHHHHHHQHHNQHQQHHHNHNHHQHQHHHRLRPHTQNEQHKETILSFAPLVPLVNIASNGQHESSFVAYQQHNDGSLANEGTQHHMLDAAHYYSQCSARVPTIDYYTVPNTTTETAPNQDANYANQVLDNSTLSTQAPNGDHRFVAAESPSESSTSPGTMSAAAASVAPDRRPSAQQQQQQQHSEFRNNNDNQQYQQQQQFYHNEIRPVPAFQEQQQHYYQSRHSFSLDDYDQQHQNQHHHYRVQQHQQHHHHHNHLPEILFHGQDYAEQARTEQQTMLGVYQEQTNGLAPAMFSSTNVVGQVADEQQQPLDKQPSLHNELAVHNARRGKCPTNTTSSTVSVAANSNNNNNNNVRRGRPKKKGANHKGKVSGKLWEFIRDLLLCERTNPSFIRWERREDGVFKFVQSDKVAKMWGERKQNPKMTYEKLSRAMRYYYKSKVLLPVFGRRLVYKFGPNATGWMPAVVGPTNANQITAQNLHRHYSCDIQQNTTTITHQLSTTTSIATDEFGN